MSDNRSSSLDTDKDHSSDRESRRQLMCLGRYERCETDWRQPDRYRDLLNFASGRRHIVQGGGLSLSGASFGDGVLVTSMRRFNRILSFDEQSFHVQAEAGVTLGELFSFLRPKGLCIPVQPGYPAITLGGCIAGNVHGKNQFNEGVFGDIVRDITLFHPSHGLMNLSRSENPHLFEATCGGYGLTGLIVSATIQVKPVAGNAVHLNYIPVANLIETVERMVAMRGESDLLYSWNDLGSIAGKGDGFIISGQFFQGDATEGCIPQYVPLNPAAKLMPFNAFNRLGLTVANNGFKFLHGRLHAKTTVRDFDVLFPFVSKKNYFSAYGRNGFIEHQVIVPHESIFDYIRTFEKIVRRAGAVIGLATFKLFEGPRKLLAFCGTGISFAIHVPVNSRSLAFLDQIDRLDLDHGAIANVIKDARLPGNIVRKQYEDFDVLQQRLFAHDPKRMFESALSRRIGL